jgi:hypothetical protein
VGDAFAGLEQGFDVRHAAAPPKASREPLHKHVRMIDTSRQVVEVLGTDEADDVCIGGVGSQGQGDAP